MKRAFQSKKTDNKKFELQTFIKLNYAHVFSIFLKLLFENSECDAG